MVVEAVAVKAMKKPTPSPEGTQPVGVAVR